MQREVNSRTSTAARVAKHRSNAARNAEDTPQKLEVRSQKSEEEKDQLTLQIWTVGKELKIEDSAIGKAIRDFGEQQTKLALEAVMREQPKDPTKYFFGCLKHRMELPQPKSDKDTDARAMKNLLSELGGR